MADQAAAAGAHSVLADQVAQLEAPKFARLSRFMAGLPVGRDGLRLPAAGYGMGRTEYLVRKVGQPSSLSCWAATWVYHQAHLPVGLWDEPSVVKHLVDRLTVAKRDVDAHPDAFSIFYGEEQQPGGGQYIPMATDAFYYIATNVATALSEAAMDEVARHFRATFGCGFAQFGFATPQSMAETAPDEVGRFAIDLLNSPSSYYFVAREGRVGIVPVTEHGLYVVSGPGGPSAATVTSALPVDVPGFSDLEALVRSSATSEADLQRFLTEHPQFLLGLNDSYCEIRPHVALSGSAGTKLIPDFMVRLEDSARFDFVELKKPGARMVGRGSDADVASAVAAKAIKQLMEYSDAVSSNAARRELVRSLGGAPFDPSLVVVIGRGDADRRRLWTSERLGLPSVQLVTYDYMLERARTARERLRAASASLQP